MNRQSVNSQDIDYPVWKLELFFNKGEFTLNVNNNAQGFPKREFKYLFNSVKPCFRRYLRNYLLGYIREFLLGEHSKKLSMRALVPVASKEAYNLSLISVKPIRQADSKRVAFSFQINYLRPYNNEKILIFVFRGQKIDRQISNRLIQSMLPPKIFTCRQWRVIQLRCVHGYSYKEIANLNFINVRAVKSVLMRATSRMESFFEMPFSNEVSAFEYYKKCFLSNTLVFCRKTKDNVDRAVKVVLPHIWGNINQFEIISPSYAIDQN